MQTELIVVGAGPAGLAAAVTAAEAGMRVAVVDLGTAPGGQYFRHSTAQSVRPAGWQTYRGLRARLRQMQHTGQLSYFSRSQVWSISETESGFTVRCRKGEREPLAIELESDYLVLAPGAHDRVLPFQGWTMPGSVSLGGAQAMWKGNATLLGRRVVIAGTGPFLLAVASDLVKAGSEVPAVVEFGSFAAMATDPQAIWLGRDKVGQALNYLGTLRRNGTRLIDHARVVEATGRNRVEQVRVVDDKSERWISCDLVATGWGFQPQLELPMQLGLATLIDDAGNLVVQVDDNQLSSNSKVWVAGEATGVAGSDCALAEGEIAGAAAAIASGHSKHAAEPARNRRDRYRAFGLRMAAAYPVPADWSRSVSDETLVCRCEEVSAGEVRAAVRAGAADFRSVKSLTRAGMGWCQGRMCGRNCSELIATEAGQPPSSSDLLASEKRSIATPIPLGLLADWDRQREL